MEPDRADAVRQRIMAKDRRSRRADIDELKGELRHVRNMLVGLVERVGRMGKRLQGMEDGLAQEETTVCLRQLPPTSDPSPSGPRG